MSRTDHTVEEAFCPGCFDYCPGEVDESDMGWACLYCGYRDRFEHIPHDVAEYDQFVEEGIIDEPRRGDRKL